MADGAHTRQMTLQDMVQQLKEMNAQQSELKVEIGDKFSDLFGMLKQALKLPEQTTVTNPNPSVETVTNPEPLVETLKNSGPFIEPLKRASVLQVPDSFCDVLLVHKLDSHVKEVEELSHESTNGNDKIVAHQVFDVLPNEYQKETLTKSEADPDQLPTITLISSPPPIKPPDPPDYKTKPTSKTSTKKKIPLRHSCEEIYERMGKGFCIFFEDLDTPGHYNLKHKRSKLCLVESVDDELPDAELVEPAVEEISNKSVNMIREKESSPENESRLEVTPQVLLSQLRIFDDESQGTFGDHTLAPMKPYQSYSQSWYELDTIQSDINFKVLVAHECDMVGAVVIYEVATTFEKLAKTWKFKFKSNPERSKLLDDMFSFMEKSLGELSGWKYKKQINQGQICLNGLCNELVCDKEKKRESIEFNECHNHRKKLQAALEGITQKIAGGLIYGDVKFHLKHKWRSRLEFCVDAILFTSSAKLLFSKNNKLLHYEAEFCAQYNDLKQLSTEFQSFPGLNYFAYLIFIWNQALNCGCEAGHISSGFFSVGDVHGDETLSKRLLVLDEISLLDNDVKVNLTIKANWFYKAPMIRGVYHLQRPPELIEPQGNPNFITKVLVQWKEHPPDQFLSGSQWQEFNFSSLRTRMFRRGKYCDRRSYKISHFTLLIYVLVYAVQLGLVHCWFYGGLYQPSAICKASLPFDET